MSNRKKAVSAILERNKKVIEQKISINRGDIFYIAKPSANWHPIGSEQQAGRPGVVVSCDANNKHSNTIEVVLLTTQNKTPLPTHVPIRSAKYESTALCEQPIPVDISRLGTYIGKCTDEEMDAIDIAMMIELGIKKENAMRLFELHEVTDKEETAEEDSAVEAVPAEELSETFEAEETNMDVVRLRTELETYKTMYTDLLNRMLTSSAK